MTYWGLLEMGIQISAPEYFERVKGMNETIVIGPPKFVELNKKQKESVEDLVVKLGETCKLCECLKTFADTITPKDTSVETALPQEQILCFDKKYLLENSVGHIEEFRKYAGSGGFILNDGIAYLGRMLRAMQSTIDDDIHDKNILPCKNSVDESMETLKDFCKTLPKQERNNNNTVWVVQNGLYAGEWKNVKYKSLNE